MISGTSVNRFSSLDVYNLLISLLLRRSRLALSGLYVLGVFFSWYGGMVAPMRKTSPPRTNTLAPVNDPFPVLILLTSVPINDNPALMVSRIL